jgi:hypothetical protein
MYGSNNTKEIKSYISCPSFIFYALYFVAVFFLSSSSLDNISVDSMNTLTTVILLLWTA